MVTFTVDDLKEMNTALKAFAEFLRSANVSDDDVFASKLVSSELIANALVHGGKRAEFFGELLPGEICITVKSDLNGNFNLRTPLPDVFAERGRGLYIIRSFGEIERVEEGLRVIIKLHYN